MTWVSRWLYNGLHSLNFPWLYNYRPLWDIVVITFMLGGTALCVTSLILAWRVLGRKLRGVVPGTSARHHLRRSGAGRIDSLTQNQLFEDVAMALLGVVVAVAHQGDVPLARHGLDQPQR